MFEVLKRRELNSTVTELTIAAPAIARKALPGQFVILRVDEKGERIPLTIADYDRTAGTIAIIFQIVGVTTAKLNGIPAGGYIRDVVGPLGNPTKLDGLEKVVVIGGGVGCAIAYPVAKALRERGCSVDAVIGFRSGDLVILEEEFKTVADKLILVTDDGSKGEKGVVTGPLERLLRNAAYDEAIAIGPVIMMKFVSLLTKKYNTKTVVSMNTIMIDGTGMCGGCRLTVGGETKFACVDGPDFDGHLVDFDEVLNTTKRFVKQEKNEREKHCNLFKREVE